MSEYYDHYHRWEPLAEFHFSINGSQPVFDDNYVYCLCSRAFIRDAVKSYYVEKEEGSESDNEMFRNKTQELEDQSHVHFSVETTDKVKYEKDEVASCYCSASHTENYCSTDEHDAAQIHVSTPHTLQPSDSGADLTYQDSHIEYTKHDKVDKINTISETNEDYLLTDTWEKFWAINGERLIWASWIKNYSDYINPNYLDDNNDLLMDDNNIPKQHSVDEIFETEVSNTNPKNIESCDFRERKFSYDSKVNPYKKRTSCQTSGDKMGRNTSINNKDHVFVPISRRRSFSEHDRMLSPRTLAGTDSMTNVTKITLSSYDVTSSHVTSESTPTDDYSLSSSTSDDLSNDQTRIANIEEHLDQNISEDLDTDNYWQLLWKKHFGEQYALHLANYVEVHNSKTNIMTNEEKVERSEQNNEKQKISESKLDSVTSLSDVLNQVEEMTIEEKVNRTKKRNKKSSNKYLGSVGVLLQSLLKEEQKKSEENEVYDANESPGGTENKCDPITTDVVEGVTNPRQSLSSINYLCHRNYDRDDDPPEEKPFTLKRSHELDEEEVETNEKIKSAFQTMGFSFNPYRMPKGLIVYRKNNSRLRPPRYKRYNAPRKTYFDDDGNSISVDQEQDTQDDEEMQSDDDCPMNAVKSRGKTCEASIAINNLNIDTSSKLETKTNTKEVTLEAAGIPLPDFDTSFSDTLDNCDYDQKEETISSNTTKRRRRQKRKGTVEVNISDMPEELQGEPKMLKYWKKRHSLFHKFDEGIKLDKESWFSVTPENVAWHIANKCVYDVVLDAFCGAGGNTIQFARTCKKVIAIDIDPAKIEMAKHNASVYGVAHKIEFIAGDFFELAPKLQADMVFLSPPWGGPTYTANDFYDIETMLEPRPASELMMVARKINTNVALYLPRNTKSDQIVALAKEAGSSVEVEQSYLDKRFVAITAYYY